MELSLDIVQYMEDSLNKSSGISLANRVGISAGFTVFTLFGVMGELRVSMTIEDKIRSLIDLNCIPLFTFLYKVLNYSPFR